VRHQSAAQLTTGSDLLYPGLLERPLSGDRTALQRRKC
jgi:hypothetical protein